MNHELLSTMDHFSIILFYASLIFLGPTAIGWADDAHAVHIYNFMPKPLLRRSENVTVLQNAGLRLQLSCSDNNPVEWVYSWQDVLYDQLRAARAAMDARPFPSSSDPSRRHHPDSSPSGLRSSFVSDYYFVPTRNSSVTRVDRTTWMASADPNTPNGYFRAMLELTYERLSLLEEYVCRSVSNHSNNKVLKLDPDVTPGEVYVTEYSRIASPIPSSSDEPEECLISFQIVRTPSNYFWRCEGAIAGAVEYFYSRGNSRLAPAHVLHTSLADISMVDLIWFDPPIPSQSQTQSPGAAAVYYTSEYLPVICFVSKYGFADYRRLLITLNGSLEEPIIDYEIDSNGDAPPNFSESNDHPESVSAWSSKEFLLHFREYGPGDYEIECRAHVWNTTEMVQQTRTLDVRNVVAPSFETEYENVTLDEGETEMRLDCYAGGDPEPQFRWNYPSVRGIHFGGSGRGDRYLHMNQVSADWHDGLTITCQAMNRFEDSATKVFNLQVKRAGRTQPEEDSSAASFSITSIVLLIIGLLAIVSLAGGLVFLYIRFVRFRGAVADFLTEQEIKEFREGNCKRANAANSAHGGYCDPNLVLFSNSYPSTTKVDGDNQEQQLLLIDSLPYNSDYEMERGKFTVDFDKQLGSGHYGVVYLGQVKGDAEVGVGKGTTTTLIAIKTVRPAVPIEYFKALLSELKILAHIGHHEHVANLVMAYTAEIKNRVLYVGVELCKCSLLQYLQDAGQIETKAPDDNYVQPGGHKIEEIAGHKYQNGPPAIDGSDLVRWAAEIANGMEFLTSKRVVHGDLAARNVLLSLGPALRAKIADFGLARQLVDYSYIKSGRCDLPWKWMALESLSKMAFSVKSDVWAYGVTCWEIFSLGEVPYACTGWTWDFVDALKNGVRLMRPEYASQIIYSKMQECWQENPKDRPRFSELVAFFRGQQVSKHSVVARARYDNLTEESRV